MAAVEDALENETPEYLAFVEKFKPKKTTDDCYTPDDVYECVLGWVRDEYGISEKTRIIRPFWPGHDFKKYDYGGDCVVVDNPPFSMQKKIVDFFNVHGVKFFLFCDGKTSMPLNGCVVFVGKSITYENGAHVRTAFITNLECGNARTAPELSRRLTQIQQDKKQLCKNRFPDNFVSFSRMEKIARHVDVKILGVICHNVGGYKVFGGGVYISDEQAAELKAAELKAAELNAAELKAAELKAGNDAFVRQFTEEEEYKLREALAGHTRQMGFEV